MDGKLFSYEECLDAFYACRKGKGHDIEAIEFEMDLYSNVRQLCHDLNKEKYEIGKFIAFVITRPVVREVFAARFRDKVVHYILVNRVIRMLEEEAFTDDAYACRPGKGTLFGIKRLAQMASEATVDYSEPGYILKCDIKSFFMHINKEKLCALFEWFIRKYADKYGMEEDKIQSTVWLFNKIIMFRPQDNCERHGNVALWKLVLRDKSLFYNNGLPIGDLPSQIFANFYLSFLDAFIRTQFQWTGRYMDDFFIIDQDKEKLINFIPDIKTFLKRFDLELHPKKIYIQEFIRGVKFIGAVIKPHRTYIGNRTKGNFWWFMRKNEIKERIEKTTEEIQSYICSINSYLGFLRHHKSFNIRKKLFNSEFFAGWTKYLKIDVFYTVVKPVEKLFPKRRAIS